MTTPESTPQRIRPMSRNDLELVLAWRNHPEIRRHMFTQQEISLEEHTRWFEKSSTTPERHLLIFERNETPQGFISLNQIFPWGIAEWGFYAAPDAPKGTGIAFGRLVLEYAFSSVGLHKLCGQTLSSNESSIRFHRRMGFKEEGRFRQQHFDGLRHHDVIHFGLLAGEWKSENQE